MESYANARVKWPYVTQHVDRSLVTGLLPVIDEVNPGSLLLARVVSIGKHRDLETVTGAKMTIFPGDLFVGALGHRYATDQFEGLARCAGTQGHIVGIGGVCGEVVTKNNRMPEPTVIEWIGRLAGPAGEPLHLSRFHAPRPHAPAPAVKPRTILSVGASMNAGKTTTAAQMIRSLTAAGHRVAAAKLTGTACRKDPNFLYDAGAVRVVDFIDAGWPSTASCSREQLLAIAGELRALLVAEEPEFIIYEIADGVVQRETLLLLEDPGFRATIDAVTFAAPDSLACESGVRLLRGLGYNVVATAGIVANSPLGIAEVQRVTGVRCLDGESILAGALIPALKGTGAGRGSSAGEATGAGGRRPSVVPMRAVRSRSLPTNGAAPAVPPYLEIFGRDAVAIARAAASAAAQADEYR